MLLAFLAACSSPAPARVSPPGLPRGPVLTLPADWETMSPTVFEAWVVREFPEDRATPIEKTSLRALAAALDRMDLGSVRAAVILGRSRYLTNAAVLIRRLERRVRGPDRHSDCGDCLAAAALARFPDPGRYARRLVPLAVGPDPHPDLEVRVECAATALHAGHEQVIPFLLQVLRIDTHAGLEDTRDFALSPTTAWARGRAAEALSTYAGVQLEYQPDGSIEHREREAARLAGILLPPADGAGGSAPARTGSGPKP